MSLNRFGFILFFLCAWATEHAWAEWSFRGVQPGELKNLEQKINYRTMDVTPENADRIIQVLQNAEHVKAVDANLLGPKQIEIEVYYFETIYELQVTGNKKVSASAIKDASELKSGDRFSRRQISEAGERVKKLYADRGFLNADVRVEYTSLGNNQVMLAFKVDESSATIFNEFIFQSENSALNKKLQGRVKHIVGEALTQSNINTIEKELTEHLRDDRYLISRLSMSSIDYSNDRSRAKAIFRITEPYRYEFIFTGSERYSDSDLLRTLQITDMEYVITDPLTEFPQRIKDQYLREGYAHVQVEVKQEVFPDRFLRRLRVHIEEGPRVQIAGFEIEGRVSRPNKYYANILEEKSSDLIDSGYYNRADLESGFKNLVTELNNQGYLRAKVVSSRLEYSLNRTRAKIFVNVDEGPLTQVKKVLFEGLKAYNYDTLLEQINIVNGAPLRLNELDASIEALKAFYRGQGHLEVKILNENSSDLVEYNDSGTQATIRYKIYEGPKIRVASIVVSGNSFTKDYVILREIDFSVGDTLTDEKLTNSQTRLNRLGLFSRVDIQTLETNTNLSDRTVVISAAERNPGLVKFGVGANNDEGFTLRGYAGISYSNLGGTARAVSGRVELQENIDNVHVLEQKYTVGYLEPFVFQTRTRGRVNYSFSKDATKTDDDLNIQYAQRADFLLERDITTHTKLTWTVWSIDAIRETLNNTPSDFQQVALFGPAIDVDYRDNIFLPTRGQYWRWNAQYSHPDIGSSETINFFKTVTSYSFYFPLTTSKRWVWANSVAGGYLKNYDHNGNGVPASNAFYLGGYTTLRGYGGTSDVETIPNQVELPTNDSDLTQIIPDESTYYMVKTEVRFPIYDPLGGVLFYDGGEVKVQGYEFKKPYHQSVGIGLRINTQLGPIVLDYARKIDPTCYGSGPTEQCEREDRFHFSIGAF